MKVILCDDVDNLGPMGETVNVAPGYARNYLLPRKLAVAADSASAKQIEHEMRIIRKREARVRAEMTGLAKNYEGMKLEFTAKAGEEGKLFGSITSLHVANRMKEMGYDVDRRKIHIDQPIKSLGEHPAAIRFRHDIEAPITIVVKPEETSDTPTKPEEVSPLQGAGGAGRIDDEDEGPPRDATAE